MISVWDFLAMLVFWSTMVYWWQWNINSTIDDILTKRDLAIAEKKDKGYCHWYGVSYATMLDFPEYANVGDLYTSFVKGQEVEWILTEDISGLSWHIHNDKQLELDFGDANEEENTCQST